VKQVSADLVVKDSHYQRSGQDAEAAISAEPYRARQPAEKIHHVTDARKGD
jgi:hypothetical protein